MSLNEKRNGLPFGFSGAASFFGSIRSEKLKWLASSRTMRTIGSSTCTEPMTGASFHTEAAFART